MQLPCINVPFSSCPVHTLHFDLSSLAYQFFSQDVIADSHKAIYLMISALVHNGTTHSCHNTGLMLNVQVHWPSHHHQKAATNSDGDTG